MNTVTSKFINLKIILSNMLKHHYHRLKERAKNQHWIFWQAVGLSVIVLVAVGSLVVRSL